MGVLVAAAHQLRQRLRSIGGVVVATTEIERAYWIVAGSYRKQPRRTFRAHEVPDGRRLGRLEAFAGKGAPVEPGRHERVRTRGLRRGGDEDGLLDAEPPEL